MAKESSALSPPLEFVSTLRRPLSIAGVADLFLKRSHSYETKARLRPQRHAGTESGLNPARILSKTSAFSAVVLASLIAAYAPTSEPAETAASRAEKMFVLFRPGAAPGVVSPKGAEEMRTPPPRYEVVHTRWVQLNDFDATTALPGDRVIVEVSPGDSYEVVLTKVDRGYEGIVVWMGTVSGRAEFSFYASFSPDGKNLFTATMHFGGSKHLVIAKPVRDMEGWLALQDLAQAVPALGPHDDPSALGDDIAKPLPPKPKQAPMRPGTDPDKR